VNNALDWKLLTILIGANDACDNCDYFGEAPIDDILSDFTLHFSGALQLIYEKFPRTLVNVVLQFNVSLVYDVADNYTYCRDFHRLAYFECPCAFFDDIAKR
jgi:hypothetical protein